MQVAFLGLGIMGSRMAQHLIPHVSSLQVWNRSEGPAEALANSGAIVADSASAAVAEADLVITMLAKPEAVAEVAWGEHGFLPAMKPGSLWIDCSTVGPTFSKEAASQAEGRQIRFLDAPVAGSKPQAEAAQLAFFVGGHAADLDQARPLFEKMGQKVLHIGSQSQGCAFKMLVNAMLAQSMIMFAEALHLGEKMGLARGFLLKALPGLPVSAPFLQAKAPMVEAQDYAVQFPLELMHKDLHLAALSAYEVGQPLYLANMAKELYAAAAKDPHYARLDFAAIVDFLQ